MCDCFLASPSALAGVGGATTGWLIDTARDAAAVAPVRLGDQEIWMFIDEYDDRDSPYFVLDAKRGNCQAGGYETHRGHTRLHRGVERS